METTIDDVIGASPAIKAIRAELEYAARSDAKVLLTGESGVGKDLAAQLIHRRSARSHMAFIAINCVGVPDSLLEPELFGHVRGSFTGAYRDRSGLLEGANKGTVFLDEVCEMSPRMQALLLRFMETGEIQRVGSDRVQARVDARVVAATNRDPAALVASKVFREDLYYRLNVIEITIPPLRARVEDIPVLLEHFLRRYAEARGIAPPAVAADAMKALVDFEWPGNVRQLKNVAERLIVRAQRAIITLADLPPEVTGRLRPSPVVPGSEERPAIEAVFDRMVKHRESFWSAVYPAFMITIGMLYLVQGRLWFGFYLIGGLSVAAAFALAAWPEAGPLTYAAAHGCCSIGLGLFLGLQARRAARSGRPLQGGGQQDTPKGPA